MKWLAMLALLCACSNDPPAQSNPGDTSTGGTTGTTTTSSSTGDGSTTTAGPEPVVVLDIELELEMRDSIDVVVSTIGDAVEVTIDPSDGFGVVQGTLVGPGRIDDYPELGATLYTATFEQPAIADGPCGEAPISLALALHRKHDSEILAGGLTAYCGAGVYFGVPVIEPLRIFGRMP